MILALLGTDNLTNLFILSSSFSFFSLIIFLLSSFAVLFSSLPKIGKFDYPYGLISFGAHQELNFKNLPSPIGYFYSNQNYFYFPFLFFFISSFINRFFFLLKLSQAMRRIRQPSRLICDCTENFRKPTLWTM